MPRPTQPRGIFVLRPLWMRRFVPLFGGTLTAIAVVSGASPGRAMARESRLLYVAPVLGARAFESKLDLQTEAAIGFRLGAGVNDRVTIWMDANHTAPSRKSTGESAHITALRALAQVRLARGPARPYLLLGAGGMLFEFADVGRDTGGGVLTGGAGLEYRSGVRTALFAEWSADLYRARTILYDSYGNVASTTPPSTGSARIVAFGVAMGF